MRGPYRNAFGDRTCYHVGQVVLLLRVVVGEAGEPAAQPMRGRNQDARVDFAQGAFSGRRVLFLDDPPHLATAADDAAVAVRIVGQHSQQRDVAAGRHQESL